mgnify:FL=1
MEERKTRKLSCIVTGRVLMATKDYYERKLARIGDEQKLHETYVCREAKDLLIKGYTVDKIREMLNVNATQLHDVDPETIAEVINSRSNTYRKINIFNTTSNLLNFKTDPDVKQLIENLKNE